MVSSFVQTRGADGQPKDVEFVSLFVAEMNRATWQITWRQSSLLRCRAWFQALCRHVVAFPFFGIKGLILDTSPHQPWSLDKESLIEIASPDILNNRRNSMD